jgi:2-keto-4-pentenoate hydratase
MTAMHADIMAALDAAERSRVAIPPLTESQPALRVEDAYAVTAAWLDSKLSAGKRLVGRKVGLTSRAVQQQLGVGEPDFGFLLDSMLAPSGATLNRHDLLQPRIEPEIAFWLASAFADQV